MPHICLQLLPRLVIIYLFWCSVSSLQQSDTSIIYILKEWTIHVKHCITYTHILGELLCRYKIIKIYFQLDSHTSKKESKKKWLLIATLSISVSSRPLPPFLEVLLLGKATKIPIHTGKILPLRAGVTPGCYKFCCRHRAA